MVQSERTPSTFLRKREGTPASQNAEQRGDEKDEEEALQEG